MLYIVMHYICRMVFVKWLFAQRILRTLVRNITTGLRNLWSPSPSRCFFGRCQAVRNRRFLRTAPGLTGYGAISSPRLIAFDLTLSSRDTMVTVPKAS